MASNEAGQPPPHSNVWTLYCLTDLREGQKSPPPLPPAGAGAPHSQEAISLSRGGYQQCGHLSQVSVMQEGGKRGDAPPFISVGSNVQDTQDWKPLPGHAVFAQQALRTGRRFAAVPVPVARLAAEEPAMASPSSSSADRTGAAPCTPEVLSVAIPLDEVMMSAQAHQLGRSTQV